MNKFCVVAKNKETYFIKRLIEEVGKNGVAVFDPWTDFILPPAQIYLARTTGVYKSDLDLMILKSLPQEKLINSVDTLKRFRSKSIQFQWFEEENFPILPWLSLKECDSLTMEKFFRLYPNCIVKPDIGQGGWGIEALTWEEFSKWWKKKQKENDKDYLLQPNVQGADEYRYFFMKGEDPLVLKRTKTSGVAANFKNLGTAGPVTLSGESREFMDQVANKSGAYYGAIDFFQTEHGIQILELNTAPGVEQLEKVSGENVLAKFLNISV